MLAYFLGIDIAGEIGGWVVGKAMRKKCVFGKSMMVVWKYSVEGTEACSVVWLLVSNAMSELINFTLGQVVALVGAFLNAMSLVYQCSE